MMPGVFFLFFARTNQPKPTTWNPAHGVCVCVVSVTHATHTPSQTTHTYTDTRTRTHATTNYRPIQRGAGGWMRRGFEWRDDVVKVPPSLKRRLPHRHERPCSHRFRRRCRCRCCCCCCCRQTDCFHGQGCDPACWPSRRPWCLAWAGRAVYHYRLCCAVHRVPPQPRPHPRHHCCHCRCH